MNSLFIKSAILGFFSLTTFLSDSSASIAIVTNAKNGINSIDLEDVKKIYLGKTRTFPDNRPAIPVDQTADTEVYQEFLSKVIEKSMKEINAYWSVKIFTGRGTPPSQLHADTQVKEWLQKNPEGLGYINLDSVDSTVKVLLKIP